MTVDDGLIRPTLDDLVAIAERANEQRDGAGQWLLAMADRAHGLHPVRDDPTRYAIAAAWLLAHADDGGPLTAEVVAVATLFAHTWHRNMIANAAVVPDHPPRVHDNPPDPESGPTTR